MSRVKTINEDRMIPTVVIHENMEAIEEAKHLVVLGEGKNGPWVAWSDMPLRDVVLLSKYLDAQITAVLLGMEDLSDEK